MEKTTGKSSGGVVAVNSRSHASNKRSSTVVVSDKAVAMREDRGDLLSKISLVLVAFYSLWAFNTFYWDHFTGLYHDPSQPLLSTARDSGLRMTLTAPFNAVYLHMHSISGTMLLFTAVMQKFSVTKFSSHDSAVPWRQVHHYLGYGLCVLMLTMSLSGFALGFSSAWANFDTFSVFFALPWLLWAVTIYLSARYQKWRFHRLVANQMIKGCLTVPASRLVGGLMQRTYPEWGEAQGYFVGIFSVALVVFIWETIDICRFLFVAPVVVTTATKKAN
eukprot:TRINITY_DN2376_c0_g1_i1.p1 TRINITY_DN2376_c0_g1~~TRINITY_DN2376_c0_g1_i1.p1  ORF type:complete len:276 (+),score=44.19 TRINITY_DN2376_c0_g1_i1:94-921(+)